MKRICAIVVREYHKRDVRYLRSMSQAWSDVGIQPVVVSTDPGIRDRIEADIFPSLARALRSARQDDAEELIVVTDDLMGPIFPLDDFLHRDEVCEANIWKLSETTPMWGVRRPSWKVAEEFTSGEELDALWRDSGAWTLYPAGELADITDVPMLDEPLKMAKDKGCPFFLHEVFHRDYGDVIATTLGHQGQVFYQWLLRESEWDTDLLWDYLLPTCHQIEYFRNLHLSYVLPTEGADTAWAEEYLSNHSLALVMHLYYPDKLQESFSYAKHFPKQTHVIVTTSDSDKQRKIAKTFSQGEFASLDVRVIENRGRDVSALLVGAAEVFDEYDYVCFFHDKKSSAAKPGSVGAGFAYRLEENLFPTTDFIRNVLRLFSQNPRLGMLSPPAPHHGGYVFTLGVDWGPNFEITERLHKRLGFCTPIAVDKMPIAPLGTCFWFRGRALKPLADHHWEYSEFPKEPNEVDGTLLHAIERIYPFACAEAGYYPAYLLSDRYASIEYSSMRYYVQEFNRMCIQQGILGYQRDMCAKLKERLQEG